MAGLGKSANVQVKLNGKELFPPLDWFDLSVKATFTENPQANITTEEFEFALSAYQEIVAHIQDGKGGGVGIFEGLDFQISTLSTLGSLSVFKGFLDLQDNLVIDEENGIVKANVKQYDGLNTLSDRLEALDYGYLEQLGLITDSDYVTIDYVVVKVDSATDTLMLSIMLFLLTKQFAESAYLIADSVATVAGIAISGITGPAGGAAYAIATALLNIIYAAALLKVIVELGRDLINTFVPPKRQHKAITLGTMLRKACERLGYGFESTITQLDSYVYLPSNPNGDEFDNDKGFLKKAQTITKGIPNIGDYGRACSEAFELARNLFLGRFQLVGNTVQFHTEGSNYWIKNSDFRKPDVQKTPKRYNTEDLSASYLISFATDIAELYTTHNYRGTSYQVITDAISVQDERRKVIKGSTEYQLPVALGSTKDSLTGFENFLARLAGVFDRAANVFFGSSNLKERVTSRVGILKVSNNNHSVPKLLYLEGGKIPKNHRELLSAKVLWEQFHSYNSFVSNNFGRQRAVYENQEVPFGFEDFVKVINNSYFYAEGNKEGKIIDLEWMMSKDKATISYWQQEVYTKNLQETFIEPA